MHTKGKWKCEADDPFVYALNLGGTYRFFASVQPGWITRDTQNRPDDERTSREELMANARLLAAAPELLEALEEVSRVLTIEEHQNPPRGWGDFLKKHVTPAISKATGAA